MIDLRYSVVIEATEAPDFFCFCSPDLEAFTGVGQSIEDCNYKAKWGMLEHVRVMEDQGLPAPPATSNPRIAIDKTVQARDTG